MRTAFYMASYTDGDVPAVDFIGYPSAEEEYIYYPEKKCWGFKQTQGKNNV